MEGLKVSRVTLEIGTIRLRFESADDLEAQLGRLGSPITEKEMAAMVGVSTQTIHRWKRLPTFPRSTSGCVTRLGFLEFLFKTNSDKSKQ